jgi:hypothetical protein
MVWSINWKAGWVSSTSGLYVSANRGIVGYGGWRLSLWTGPLGRSCGPLVVVVPSGDRRRFGGGRWVEEAAGMERSGGDVVKIGGWERPNG